MARRAALLARVRHACRRGRRGARRGERESSCTRPPSSVGARTASPNAIALPARRPAVRTIPRTARRLSALPARPPPVAIEDQESEQRHEQRVGQKPVRAPERQQRPFFTSTARSRSQQHLRLDNQWYNSIMLTVSAFRVSKSGGVQTAAFRCAVISRVGPWSALSYTMVQWKIFK